MFGPISNRFFMLFLTLMLCSCAPSTTPSVKQVTTYGAGSRVAVWDLENISVMQGSMTAGMEEFLTGRVADTLGRQGGFLLIEREKLLLALEELSLGSSQLVNDSSRLELGRILGVQLMVFGAYQIVGEQIRIDLRLVEVETGLVLATSEKTTRSANVAGWLDGAEEAAGILLVSAGL